MSSLPDSLSALILSFLPRDDQARVLSAVAAPSVEAASTWDAIASDQALVFDDNDETASWRVFTRSNVTALTSPARHFVVDHFLATRPAACATIDEVRRDAEHLLVSGRLRRAGMVTASVGAVDASSKYVESSLRGDSLLWLSDAVLNEVPAIQSAVVAMRAALGELERVCGFVAGKTTVQLAHYARGARYVRHLDATPLHASGRRLTMLLYLNPAWCAADGGELRLFDDGDAARVDVAPLGDRLLVFQSHGVPHEVLESRAESRFSLTLWAYAATVTETARAGAQTPSTES